VAQPLGYSPTGNATAEVIWKHVEQACKPPHAFPAEQCWLHEIAYEWNTQTTTATGMAPFMVQFGAPPVTALAQLSRGSAASATAVPLVDGEDDSVRAATDVAAVVGVAVRRANYQRHSRAADLNLASRGSLRPLEVGSKAFVYQPPSGAVVNRRGEGRNRAFVASFTGPATITTRLSATGYVLVDDETGTRYNRHRRHLRPVHGDFLIAHIDYLCDWMTVQMGHVRREPLQRCFLTLPHLEEGDLDHSTRVGAEPEKQRPRRDQLGEEQTARWSRGMGRWGFGCTHHARVENQPSADDVGWAGRLEGGRRVRWAEGQTTRW
jgi:hypothetical protein